jgi:hypothetical protein
MEKHIHSITYHPYGVLLFLSDIKKIFEIFSETNKNVTIKTSEYIVHNIDELLSLDIDKINYLFFSIDNPKIHLELKGDQNTLHSASDDYLSKGIFNTLKNFLSSKKKFNFFKSPFLYLALVFFSLLFILNYSYIFNLYKLILSIFFFLISLSLSIYSIKYWTEWQTIIYLKTNENESSFFKRKKDDLILQILLNLISAGIGSFITYVVLNR